MSNLGDVIASGWERRAEIGPGRVDAQLKDAIERVIADLDAGTTARRRKARRRLDRATSGSRRPCCCRSGSHDNRVIEARLHALLRQGAAEVRRRTTPSASRRAACASCRRRSRAAARSSRRNVVLMPSYVNIGAYVDEGTMVDTWATVGSCAQIGKNVHLSGGVGIGGVLEPLQAEPDHHRGQLLHRRALGGRRRRHRRGELGARMGVFIGQSTKIYDRATGEVRYGRVPAGSVVVAGSLPASRRQATASTAP